jgi:hypothetical protein
MSSGFGERDAFEHFDEPHFAIGELARALGVPARRVRRWIRAGQFPETPYWHQGRAPQAHRRRYTRGMIDFAVRIAREFGLDTKQRWDLAESDFGDRVADAWQRTEQPKGPWAGRRGWPDTNPANIVDYSTPEKVRAAEMARIQALKKRRDDRILDLSTDEAREANNRGEPRYATPPRW